jgi:hypothetical protein
MIGSSVLCLRTPYGIILTGFGLSDRDDRLALVELLQEDRVLGII